MGHLAWWSQQGDGHMGQIVILCRSHNMVLFFLLLFVLICASTTQPVRSKIAKDNDLEDSDLVDIHSYVRKIRKKRFLPGLNIANLLNIAIFPTPFFPTNIIGLQGTRPAPKRRVPK